VAQQRGLGLGRFTADVSRPHTHTLGRTPLYEWSVRLRGRYIYNTNTTNTREEHPCFKRDSNPQSQQPSGSRPINAR